MELRKEQERETKRALEINSAAKQDRRTAARAFSFMPAGLVCRQTARQADRGARRESSPGPFIGKAPGFPYSYVLTLDWLDRKVSQSVSQSQSVRERERKKEKERICFTLRRRIVHLKARLGQFKRVCFTCSGSILYCTGVSLSFGT